MPIKKRFQIHCSTCFSSFACILFTPQLTRKDGKEYFYLLELQHVHGEMKTFDSLSQLLDRFYFGKAERDRVKQQAADLERFVVNEKKKK
ncbi:hypothetical protein BsIDN1_28320 [Bacillus safensis]|uniref:Uncharacterized protein n=1 Tax=Bacillus safensis TaxID=561879 RepID=A0A5S9MAN3_BACIA|nr:hypothetical protein BsIDN1_28320 [Bacillus safensis]